MLSKHAFGYGTKLHQKLGLIAVLMMQTEFFCWTNETYQNKWNYNFLNLGCWIWLKENHNSPSWQVDLHPGGLKFESEVVSAGNIGV